ncbi:hypothetical protein PXH69_24385 [Rhodococcus qingshengii]|uniref:Uncharacterized protein n=1 Tax=Rhodococcus qingshengii TaxID=334542 RepID=A0AAW6LM83_RHOSG|nr:hypothetical protein [Rhodococcus qingshengii]MDE8648109.1 hypothetical protein [Rhodococcus qingshengii]
METQEVSFVEIEARELNYGSIGLRFKVDGEVKFIRAVDLSYAQIKIWYSSEDRGGYTEWWPTHADTLLSVEESDEHPSK